MTPSRCSTCHRPCVVGMSFEQRVGRRVVTWRLCVPCHLKEQRDR